LKRVLLLIATTLLAALVPAGVQLANATPASRAIHASLKSFVLTKADVTSVYGSGFTAGRGLAQKNTSDKSKCANAKSADEYVVSFSRSNGFTVFSNVSAFKDASTVQCELRYGLILIKQENKIKGVKMHSSSLGGIGDSAYLVTSTIASGKTHIYGTDVIFTKGRYAASVEVGGKQSNIKTNDVVGLAHVVEGRISSGG
jgi:hypothetical protein